MTFRPLLTAAILAGTLLHGAASAETLRIAAASNLRGTLDRIATDYTLQVEGAPAIDVIFGSTGKLYAQILQGARYDLFFGADVEHARRLEVRGIARSGSRFTYAIGRLALIAGDRELGAPRERLEALDFEHLAIANPRLAPYGQAALEVIGTLDRPAEAERRLVKGEDVGKAFHFVRSGAADLGFVPFSLLRRRAAESAVAESAWLVPAELHAPLEQQAVQLTESAAVTGFLDFVRGESSRALFAEGGYDLP